MNYKVNLAALDSSFRVPNALADNFIKLANPKHMIVLLWVLRHAQTPKSAEQIAEELHIDKAIVNEAIFYWIDNGFIVPEGVDGVTTVRIEPVRQAPAPTAPKASQPTADTPPAESEKRLGSSMASDEEILQRAKESAEFKFLLQKSQQIYGRTISKAERSMLLSLMDYYGLPVEVILMLIQYAVSAGRTGTNYIHTVGICWAEEGIRTHEQAEEKIAVLQKSNKLWNAFVQQAGIAHRNPTKKQQAYFDKWTGEWQMSTELIACAYEEMLDAIDKVNYKYLDKILTTWHEADIQSLAQLQAFEKAKASAAPKGSGDSAPSFSVDKFNDYIESFDLKYEKKEEDE